MELPPAVGLGAVILLVLANGFFVATEFAIVAVRRSRLEELMRDGRSGARAAIQVVSHLDAYIAATQFGITLASLALGWIGEPALAHLLEPALTVIAGSHSAAAAHGTAIALSFATITALHIVLGELAPKGLALQRAETTTLWVARPIQIFYAVFKWPVTALNAVGNGALRMFGFQPASGHEMVHSVEELRLLVTGMQRAGVVDAAEAQIAKRAFSFGDVTAGALMTPRTEMDAVSIDDTPESIIGRLERRQHRRLPVYQGTIDNIVGVLDMLRLLRGGGSSSDLRPLLEPPLVVPETSSAAELLAQMRERGARMAVLVDEYGGTAGIVTFRNLFEALVGRTAPQPLTEMETAGGAVLDGLMRADEFSELVGVALDEDRFAGVETLGGLVTTALGRVPQVGEEAEIGGRHLRVEARDGMRVAKVRLLP